MGIKAGGANMCPIWASRLCPALPYHLDFFWSPANWKVRVQLRVEKQSTITLESSLSYRDKGLSMAIHPHPHHTQCTAHWCRIKRSQQGSTLSTIYDGGRVTFLPSLFALWNEGNSCLGVLSALGFHVVELCTGVFPSMQIPDWVRTETDFSSKDPESS